MLRSVAPVFSPDSSRVALPVFRGGECFVVVDGEEWPYHTVGYIAPLIFSADSARLAYRIHANGSSPKRGECVVLDGKPHRRFTRAGFNMVFSPDSRHLAYRATSDQSLLQLTGMGRDALVVDGRAISRHKSIRGPGPIFSPDSKRIAYVVAHRGGQQSVVINGTPGTPFDRIWSLTFDTPDALHYIARDPTGLYLVEEKLH